jgi:hypothetical protein
MERQDPDQQASGGSETWDDHHRWIVAGEIKAINQRRKAEERRRAAAEDEKRKSIPSYISPDPPFAEIRDRGAGKTIDAVGLALSGGGIRSSAICLGVLQALNHFNLIRRIDYLSTVSGGGYIGSSVTATMTTADRFPFGAAPEGGLQNEAASEISDTPAVGHLRNYSNYLIPAGARDLLTGIAIVVRGLVANLGLTLPIVLLLAAVTIASNAARSCIYATNFFGLRVDQSGVLASLFKTQPLLVEFGFLLIGAGVALLVLLGREVAYWRSARSGRGRSVIAAYIAGIVFVVGLICTLSYWLPVDHFGLTLAAAMLGLALFLLWALVRSFLPADRLGEFRGHLPTMGATYLVLVLLIGFFEFQPFMIGQMFDVAEGSTDLTNGVVAGVVIGWVKWLAAVSAPIAAAVTLFRQQFGELLKGAAAQDWTSRIVAHLARAIIWVAGAALPLLIWVGFLYLSWWGIANDKVLEKRSCADAVEWEAPSAADAAAKSPQALSGKIQFDSSARTLNAEIATRADGKSPAAKPREPMAHTPGWLLSVAKPLAHRFGWDPHWSFVAIYVALGSLLFALSYLLKPNANSLHRLYRDRLSKAFLFDPTPPAGARPGLNIPSIAQGRDFVELNTRLSDLCPINRTTGEPELKAPYHLINAALNIQGSDYANRRGRNADFFLFSALYLGSEATGYAETVKFERVQPGLDLATAIAISGAAASSNMGSSSIKSLTPTLALLNVRLGYWLVNPKYIDAPGKPQHRSTPLYLWSEISGRLYENSDSVYLTDGGHIENLGVYELLRRRCKVIIAVDAEADGPMNFSALMTLQRYARIDLGILIDLPWRAIRTQTLAWMDHNAGKAPPPPPAPALESKSGPHVAIGSIDYGAGEKGYLVYIKSSLTGDENDYIRDYARRYNRFPHEPTGDQFFSEEQFEVYRALGFHMLNRLLCGKDNVATVDGAPDTKFVNGAAPSIDAIRAALGLVKEGEAGKAVDIESLQRKGFST